MSNATQLVYQGVIIRDAADMLSLTDMWKAAGSPTNKEPFNWARFEGRVFLEAVALNLNLSDAQVMVSKPGKNGGTWANWQGAFAYAKYLSPDFHMWCNEVVRAYMEGKLVPAQPAVPQTLAQALRLAADQAEKIEQQTAMIQVMAPKVAFHDDVAEAINAQTLMDVAKTLRTGRTRFARWLRDRKFLQENNRPYQPFEDAGYFRVVTKRRRDQNSGEVVSYPQTLVTGKGLIYLQRKWAEDHPNPQSSLSLEDE